MNADYLNTIDWNSPRNLKNVCDASNQADFRHKDEYKAL
jgi:hypothetical protein